MLKGEEVSAIILAAGYSSRALDFKPLLPLGGMTLLERAVRLFQKAGIEDLRVVLGYRAADLLLLLQEWNIPAVINEEYATGMFSSVTAGVASLEPDRKAFFLLPVDIPLVRPQTLLELMQAYPEGREDCIIHPVFHSRRGHPPLIAFRYAKEITEWKRSGGLSSFLRKFDSIAVYVEVSDEYIHWDLDTPEEYPKFVKRLSETGDPLSQ